MEHCQTLSDTFQFIENGAKSNHSKFRSKQVYRTEATAQA